MSPEVTVREDTVETVLQSEEYFAFPLTPGQAAMLPANLDGKADSRFNGAFRMNLEGPVDSLLLQQSLQEIVNRHEILRTVFRKVDTEVMQIVLPNPALSFNTVDLRGLSQDEQAAQMDEICIKEAQTNFELVNDPPIRIRLLKQADTKSMLVLTAHQVICDGWSMGIFMEELAKIYTALSGGFPSPLPPLEFQFGDYVVWQHEMADRPEALAQLEYWKDRLSGAPQIEVAPDYDATSLSIRSAIVSDLLPEDLSKEIRSLAQSQSTTFFVISMAACMALLYRYTGRSEIALRTPLAGRTRIEFEPLIGQFVNQVIVRSDVAGNKSFAQLVELVRERVWEALANQDVPFDTVIHTVVAPEADSNEIFRINFVCQKEYGRGGPFQFELAGTHLTTMPSKSQGALYDLNFFLVEREAGWRLSLEYKSDLYSSRTVESLLQHFIEVLRQVSSDPNKKISDILLSRTEGLTKRMPPDTETVERADSDLDELPVVQAIPASYAQIRFWTLSEVDPSNPAFHMPVSLRITGNLSVPILEKSFRLLIDHHETLRTSFSEMDGELMQVIHEGVPFELTVIEVEAKAESERKAFLDACVQSLQEQPFDLSVPQLFRAVLYRLSPEEHILALSIHHVIADAWSIQIFQKELWTAYETLQQNPAFHYEPLALQYGDFSIWQRESVESAATKEHLDYWMETLSGELPVLDFPTDRDPSQIATPRSSLETRLFPDDLARSLKALAQANNTTLYVVTLASFSMLLSRATDATDVIIGSPVVNRRIETEPLIGPFAGPVALRLGLPRDRSLREILHSVRDTTLEALGHTELPFEKLLEELSVRPTNGRSSLFQFYFFCQPAFLQARELDNLTITPLPTTSVGLPFEIQLAVIERTEGVRAQLEYNANLFDSSSIKEWLSYYESILIALTSNPDQRLSDLPKPPHHSQELPKISAVSDSQPSTTSGALSTTHAAVFIDDDVTKELTEIWKSALNLSSIEPHDNFFLLGGRSLVAARLIAKINKRYSLKLGLATLFNFPTIAELSGLIRGKITTDAPTSIVTVQSGGAATPLFMVHGVGGNVLNFYDLARNLGPERPVYGIEAQSLHPDATPLMKLEDLATYYVSEVRKVQPAGPYNFLGYSYGGFVAYEMARQLQTVGEKVSLVGMLDTPVWRHAVQEESRPLRKLGRQLLAVWSPFLYRLRPLTPMEIFDATKSSILRTFYTFATASTMVIPPKLRSVYHINSFAAVNYVPKRYDGQVTILRASREKGPRDLGWGRFTSQPARIFEIPGAHLQVLSNENLPRVVKSLKECLL
jgi:thioesterase domain-containing protein/non-ribosomal peptide synthetase component F/acyl carrier protein